MLLLLVSTLGTKSLVLAFFWLMLPVACADWISGVWRMQLRSELDLSSSATKFR